MLSKNRAVPNDEQVWIEHGPNMFPALLNQNFMMPAYNFCFPAEEASQTFSWLISELYAEGGCLIGNNAFQIVRIESGMPDWGTELTEDYNPHEARLINAVSFTKGCYTGQEVIARLDTYDKVQKYLMIVDMGERITKPPPHDIYLEDDKIGVLTSFTRNPLNNRNIGLGYVKKNYTVNDFDLKVEVLQDEKRIPSVIRKPPTAI
jgi:folate-binding protein YgfZ